VSDTSRRSELTRRRLLAASAAASAAALALRLGLGGPSGTAHVQDTDWAAAPDMTKAKERAAEIVTYGIPDDWANYGEVFKAFQASLGVVGGKHTDTDMSSLEEITKFDAEKSNPVAQVADIGMLWGRVAEEKAVVPAYLPPNAESLPEGYKAVDGGWVATFAGVPAFVVNTDVVTTLPATWADLLKPEFKGKIGSAGDPRTSGTAQATLLAWTYAAGGDSTNLEPGVEFSKQIIQSYNPADASLDLLAKGEIVLWMRYDFNCAAAVNELKEKGINAQVVIPGVSVYAPSAIMANRYNASKVDSTKMLLDYVLGDEAAALFAKFGARPIKYVLGQIELPEEARANWLPDEDYAEVVVIEDFTGIDAEAITTLWDEDVLGG